MNQSIRMQRKIKNQRKVFILAWTIAQDRKQKFSDALHSAWVVYKNKNLIIPFLTTLSTSEKINEKFNRALKF